jgi:hypothetical protein
MFCPNRPKVRWAGDEELDSTITSITAHKRTNRNRPDHDFTKRPLHARAPREGLIVLAVSAAGLTGVATGAIFIDSAAVTAGPFTAGTVSLTAVPVTTFYPWPAWHPATC